MNANETWTTAEKIWIISFALLGCASFLLSMVSSMQGIMPEPWPYRYGATLTISVVTLFSLHGKRNGEDRRSVFIAIVVFFIAWGIPLSLVEIYVVTHGLVEIAWVIYWLGVVFALYSCAFGVRTVESTPSGLEHGVALRQLHEFGRNEAKWDLLAFICRLSRFRGERIHTSGWTYNGIRAHSRTIGILLSDLYHEGLISYAGARSIVVLTERGWIESERRLNPRSSNYYQNIVNSTNVQAAQGENSRILGDQHSEGQSLAMQLAEALRADAGVTTSPAEEDRANHYAREIESAGTVKSAQGQQLVAQIQGFLDLANGSYQATRSILEIIGMN
ncbi:hypothetical protein ACFOVU_11375 [Nocardiopsis sediminis]|uniref:Uncharacterized protein n=1 Tax=Nocardiopsis sediminis TaxID=1778267 RepID=A0ABV8FNN9_9ACTN